MAKGRQLSYGLPLRANHAFDFSKSSLGIRSFDWYVFGRSDVRLGRPSSNYKTQIHAQQGETRWHNSPSQDD